MSAPIVDRKTELIQEYMRCRDDFHHFCSNHIYLELPGGDELFKPYKRQSELIDSINKEKYLLVLKSRQIGISTILKAYAAWLTVFYDNVVVGIISKDGRESTAFARDIRKMIDKLPKWMRPGYDKYTEQSFILNNGSKVFSSPVNPVAPENTLRGKAITVLIIDEAAFVKYIDKAWVAMVPALSTAQMQARKANIPYGTVILSTPNKTVGTGAWYYSKYQSSIAKTDIFKEFTIHWKQIPELADDPEWYKTQCMMFDNDPKKIKQELELTFFGAEGSFFPEETVIKLQQQDYTPIEISKLFGGEIWKFAEPIEGRYYIIGVDTAPENGIDKSTITVWDYQTLEQVWEYQVKCAVKDFTKVVKFACSQYQGVIVVENNSYGNQVVEELNTSDFSVMLYKEKRGQNVVVPGVSTNSKTRPLMIDALYSYVCQFPECIKSKRLITELIGLVEKSGKVQADTGCADDLALSAAFAFYVRKYDPPLMIDTSRFHESIFNQVMDMNTTVRGVMNYGDDYESKLKSQDLNVEIMKEVKDTIFKDEKSYVDILSFYGRG